VTGGVSMPNIDQNIGERLACVYIDDTDIHEEEDTRLPFGHVLSDGVSPGVVAAGIARDQPQVR
jgi:hypothetical protein